MRILPLGNKSSYIHSQVDLWITICIQKLESQSSITSLFIIDQKPPLLILNVYITLSTLELISWSFFTMLLCIMLAQLVLTTFQLIHTLCFPPLPTNLLEAFQGFHITPMLLLIACFVWINNRMLTKFFGTSALLMAKLFLSFMILALFVMDRVSSRLGIEFTMILCPR